MPSNKNPAVLEYLIQKASKNRDQVNMVSKPLFYSVGIIMTLYAGV